MRPSSCVTALYLCWTSCKLWKYGLDEHAYCLQACMRTSEYLTTCCQHSLVPRAQHHRSNGRFFGPLFKDVVDSNSCSVTCLVTPTWPLSVRKECAPPSVTHDRDSSHGRLNLQLPVSITPWMRYNMNTSVDASSVVLVLALS